MTMTMIPSSSTSVDVHTDARTSRSSRSSRSSSSRRASFGRRPSPPTTAVILSFIHSCINASAQPINHDTGRSPRDHGRPPRAVPGVSHAHSWPRDRTNYTGPTHHFTWSGRTNTPYLNSMNPILQKTRARTTPVGRRVRATDDRCRWMTATTARARREDDGDGDGDDGRRCREGYRTGYSPCSRCERRRDETDKGRMMWRREGARDG